MTKLDAVLERARQLPPGQQEAIAAEIEFLLAHDELPSALTPEQEVAACFEKKFGW